MKFQNPSLNSVLKGRKDERMNERTSRNQYAPHFFKVGGIISQYYQKRFLSEKSLKQVIIEITCLSKSFD